MKRVAWLGTLLVSLSFQINSSLASDAEYRWDWTLSSQSMQPRDSLYTAPADSAQQINALLDLEINKESWTGLFAVKADNLYSSESTSRDSTFIISELFYQGEFQIGSENMEYQLGKVRQDWGVGYGYRPLDILKPFRRNPVGIQVEEGTGLLSLSRFDMNGEWTLFYSDSSWNSQDGNEIEQQSEQQGFGVRRYLLSGNSEYQALAYYDDVRHGLLGASFITVPDIAWELHGSLTWHQRHLAYQLPNENTKPVSLEQRGNAWQALAGFTWTSNAGHQLISEYWYDSRSWHRSDWQLAHQRTEDLAQQPAFDSLRYSYANGFNHNQLDGTQPDVALESGHHGMVYAKHCARLDYRCHTNHGSTLLTAGRLGLLVHGGLTMSCTTLEIPVSNWDLPHVFSPGKATLCMPIYQTSI